MILEGGRGGYTFVEKEKIHRGVGELMLLGPGLPHWGVIENFPVSSITVYFLPWVLVEMGPESDGVRILRRFTGQAICRRTGGSISSKISGGMPAAF